METVSLKMVMQGKKVDWTKPIRTVSGNHVVEYIKQLDYSADHEVQIDGYGRVYDDYGVHRYSECPDIVNVEPEAQMTNEELVAKFREVEQQLTPIEQELQKRGFKFEAPDGSPIEFVEVSRIYRIEEF